MNSIPLNTLSYTKPPEPTKLELLEAKYSPEVVTHTKAWLDRLEGFECKDCGPRYRVLDTNNRYSYSCLQFQLDTFKEQALKYGILTGNFEEEIYDCQVQKTVALAMILDDRNNARHWHTSVFTRGLGLPPMR